MNIYEYYEKLQSGDNDAEKKKMMEKYNSLSRDPQTGEVDESNLSFSERFFNRATDSISTAFSRATQWVEENPVKTGVLAAAVVVGSYYFLTRDTREKYEQVADNAYSKIEEGFMASVSRWVQERQADINAFTSKNFSGVKLFDDQSGLRRDDPAKVADEIVKRNNSTRSQQQDYINNQSGSATSTGNSTDLTPAIDLSNLP